MGPLIRVLLGLVRPLAGVAKKHAPQFLGSLARNSAQKLKRRRSQRRRQQAQQQQQQQNQPSPATPNQPSVLNALVQASGAIFRQKASGARQQARGGLRAFGQAAFRVFAQKSPAPTAQRVRRRQSAPPTLRSRLGGLFGGQPPARSRRRGQAPKGGVLRSLASHARGLFEQQRQRRQQPKKPGLFGSILTRAAALRVEKPDPATMPGLSPKQKLGMMGQSAAAVQSAHRTAQEEQAKLEHRKRAEAEEERIREKLKEGFEKLAGRTAKLVTAFLGLKLAMSKFGETMSELNRDLSRFSGRLSASFARLEAQRLQLDRRTAQQTGGTATLLNEAVHEFREANQPNVEDRKRIQNVLGFAATKVATWMAEVQNWISQNSGIRWVLDEIEENTKPDHPVFGKGRHVIDGLQRREFLPPLPRPPEG